MALSFSVFNKFKAIDGVTAPFRRMSKSAGKFGRNTVSAFKKSDRQASKFNKTLKALFVGAAIIGGIALLQQGIRSVTQQFIEFDDSIIAAGARFIDIGPDVENFTDRIKGIKAAARDAGSTTEFTATQAAKGLDFLARAGFTSAEAIGSLVSMINLATASGEDFAAVADMSSDLLGAFGLNADNTAQKIKNLNRLNDVLAKSVNSANVTIESMFDTMKQIGPVATGVLGASLEEVAALTSVLGSSGIKGSEAMTALKNAYLRLAAPTSKASKILKKYNVSMDDGQGGARKMTDVLEELGSKISDLGKIPQAAILNEVFGKRAIAGGKNLIDNIKNIKKFEQSLIDAGGVSQRTADLIRTSLGNRLKALSSALTEFGFKILENFEIKGKDAISGLTQMVREFDVQPIIDDFKDLINVHILLLKTIKPVTDFLIKTFKVIKNLIGANKEIFPTIIIVTELLVGLKIALLAFNVIMAVTNALMIANPIGLIIVAIAAVVLAIRQIIKHWSALKREFVDAKKWIVDTFNDLNMFAKIALMINPFTAAIIGITFLSSKIDLLIEKWKTLKDFFSNFGENVSQVLSNIAGSNIAESIESKVLGMAESIKSKLSGMANKIKLFVSLIGAFFKTIFSGSTNDILNMFMFLGEKVKGIFSGIGDFISGIFSGLGDKVKNILSGLGDKIKDFFGDKEIDIKTNQIKPNIDPFENKKLIADVPKQFRDKEDSQTVEPKLFRPDLQQQNNQVISPNSEVINTLKEETENRSRVDVNFNNLPKDAEVEQKGRFDNLNLNMGYSGA